MKKIILHIGTEKTGTTSIQHALAHDRNLLRKNGFLYPVLFGSENHMEVSVHAMEDDVSDELRQRELAKANCGLQEYRARLRKKLSKEIEEAGCDTLIISNEHCHSRLDKVSSIMRLRRFLENFCDHFEVIVYLRRQDLLAVSLYSTRLKLGGVGPVFPQNAAENKNQYFHFDTLLERYLEVFGQGNIQVRLFEPVFLVNNDVVSDFYSLSGIPTEAPRLPRANESLSAIQGLFLQRFNEMFPIIVEGKLNSLRGPIFGAIANTHTGAPYRPERKEAISFYENFSEGNSKVKNTFFPDLDRDTLFNESFSSYPEKAEQVELTTEQMFGFVEAIWRHSRRASKN